MKCQIRVTHHFAKWSRTAHTDFPQAAGFSFPCSSDVYCSLHRCIIAPTPTGLHCTAMHATMQRCNDVDCICMHCMQRCNDRTQRRGLHHCMLRCNDRTQRRGLHHCMLQCNDNGCGSLYCLSHLRCKGTTSKGLTGLTIAAWKSTPSIPSGVPCSSTRIRG
jgi:hypothetical protein